MNLRGVQVEIDSAPRRDPIAVYQLVRFPAREHEELVTVWLWSERAGVLSHQTALALHGLSDALPAHVHLTLPSAWRQRRFRVPADVVLHHSNVPQEESHLVRGSAHNQPTALAERLRS